MASQAVFRKATVLYQMGQVDKSLQVFLQCLALDESFPCAKRHMEKVGASGLADGLSAGLHKCVSTPKSGSAEQISCHWLVLLLACLSSTHKPARC